MEEAVGGAKTAKAWESLCGWGRKWNGVGGGQSHDPGGDAEERAQEGHLGGSVS